MEKERENGCKWSKDLIYQVHARLAATMTFVTLGLIILTLSSCKEKEEQKSVEVKPDFKPQGLVLFALGDVTVGGKQLKAGDTISDNESLRTGKKSACDLQITGLDSDVTVRLRENSDFALVGFLKKDVKNLQPKILTGKILVNTRQGAQVIVHSSIIMIRNM